MLRLVREELRGDDRADRVAAAVLGTGVAAAVPEEPGHRLGAAGLQLPAQDVALGHCANVRTVGRIETSRVLVET